MIKLLKEDYTYHRITLFVVFAIGILMILLDIVLGSADIDMMMGTTTIAFFITMLIMGITEDGEKRERLQKLLPISLKQFGFVRLLFILVFQAGIAFLWIIHMLFRYSDDSGRLLLNIFSNTGYNLSFLSFFISIDYDEGES